MMRPSRVLRNPDTPRGRFQPTMATTKKKAALSPDDTAGEAPEISRTAPFKPRNIAAYEAAVEQFTTASALFLGGRFGEARPLFEAVSVAATPDRPHLAERSPTSASTFTRKVV